MVYHIKISDIFVIIAKKRERNFTKFPIAFLTAGGYNNTIKRDSETGECRKEVQ